MPVDASALSLRPHECANSLAVSGFSLRVDSAAGPSVSASDSTAESRPGAEEGAAECTAESDGQMAESRRAAVFPSLLASGPTAGAEDPLTPLAALSPFPGIGARPSPHRVPALDLSALAAAAEDQENRDGPAVAIKESSSAPVSPRRAWGLLGAAAKLSARAVGGVVGLPVRTVLAAGGAANGVARALSARGENRPEGLSRGSVVA